MRRPMFSEAIRYTFLLIKYWENINIQHGGLNMGV